MHGHANVKADHDGSDDDGVKWLPPWSFAEREQWAKAHPALAGFYFGVIAGITLGEYVTIRTGVGTGILVGLATLACSWPLFALALIRRWFERPNGENLDFASTLRRPLSRLPDRILWWFTCVFAFGTLVSVIGLVAGPARVSAAFTLSLNLVLLAAAWIERQRRRASP